jgi:hypothetical protein
MAGATLPECSESGDAIIEHMSRGEALSIKTA